MAINATIDCAVLFDNDALCFVAEMVDNRQQIFE